MTEPSPPAGPAPEASARHAATPAVEPSAGLRLAREGALYVLALFLLRASNFLLIPLYLSLLDQEQYGAFGVVRNVVNVMVPVVVVAQAHSLLRLGVDVEGDEDGRQKLLGSVITWVLLASGLAVGLAALCWPLLEHWLPGVPLWPLGMAGLAVVAGQSLFQMSQAWLRNDRRAKEHTWLAVGRIVVLVVAIAIFLPWLDLGSTGLLLSIAISFAVVSAWSLRAVVGLERLRMHWPSLKASLLYGLPLVPHALSTVIFAATDQVLLAAHDDYGLGVAGVYLLAAQLASAVQIFSQGLQKAWTPFYLREDRDHATEGWSRVRVLSFFALAAVGGATVVVGLLAPEVVALAGAFSGSDWSSATQVVPILVLGGFLRAYYLVAFAVVAANKSAARWIALVTLPAAGLNIWLNALWIPEHGMQGAAFATVVSWAAAAVALGLMARTARKVPFKYAHAAVLPMLVVGALWIGVGASLPVRLAAIFGFGTAVMLLDGRDLLKAVRTLRKRG